MALLFCKYYKETIGRLKIQSVILLTFKQNAETYTICGFTPQYNELQKLYEQYGNRGLEILAFPCNQFMNQEPGTDDEISSFCTLNFGVTFPIMAKVDVNG